MAELMRAGMVTVNDVSSDGTTFPPVVVTSMSAILTAWSPDGTSSEATTVRFKKSFHSALWRKGLAVATVTG